MPLLGRGCAILTEVEQVRDGVSDAVDEDEHPGQLVEVDVLVEWQEAAEPSRPQEGDAVSQHQHQHEHAVEVETLTYRKVSFSTDFVSYYIIITNRKQNSGFIIRSNGLVCFDSQISRYLIS